MSVLFGSVLDEMIIEKLMAKRDLYLYALKHLDFQILTESLEGNYECERLKTSTISELKTIEQEIAFLLSKKES